MKNDIKKYAVWEDEKHSCCYGLTTEAKGEIIVYCETFDEARIAWKGFYYEEFYHKNKEFYKNIIPLNK